MLKAGLSFSQINQQVLQLLQGCQPKYIPPEKGENCCLVDAGAEVEGVSDALKEAFFRAPLRFARHVQLSYEFHRVYSLIVYTDFNELNI